MQRESSEIHDLSIAWRTSQGTNQGLCFDNMHEMQNPEICVSEVLNVIQIVNWSVSCSSFVIG